MRILFVNPSRVNCGIHQFGKRVYDALEKHLFALSGFEIVYTETYDKLPDDAILTYRPDLILWSFNATALPAIAGDRDHKITAKEKYPIIKHIGICHEQEQVMVDKPYLNEWHWFGAPGFDAWIGHDPTLVIDEDEHPNLFRATRPVIRSAWRSPNEEDSRSLIFGNSTFGFKNKGHVRICEAIASEYPRAIIRFNMPPSEYGDPFLAQAKEVEAKCRETLTRYPGVKLEVTHKMFETEENLLEFFYDNDVNIFDYDQGRVPEDMRGVASSPDTALSTRRPLIVTGCTMFKHLHPMFGRYPTDGSISELIGRQLACNVPDYAYNEWTPARMTADYVKAINKVMAR